MEAANVLDQRDIKGDTGDCFVFGIWFASNMLAESEMGVDLDMIGMFQTNIKGSCKDTIENMTKDWSGGSYP